MIKTHEEKALHSDFFGVKIVNGQVTTVHVHTPIPLTADGFEKVIQDLRALRKLIWPNYIDTNTQHIRFDVGEKIRGSTDIPTRVKGKVKWFNDAKGFGFVDTDEPKSRSIFVHFTAIQKEGFRSLAEGERIEFEIHEGPHGPTAMNVKPI